VQRPAAIVNYQSTGDAPLLLGGALAVGTMAALALSLLSSVRRRRRDLAVLKTLGFTRAQTVGAVVSQALTVALVADVVGIPVGVASGRQLWRAFAQSIDVVPRPTVPLSVALVALGTVAISVVVAVLPGWLASRTAPAQVLRHE
jgi:ABC-type antimicrobial peptide transport system permease subunit